MPTPTPPSDRQINDGGPAFPHEPYSVDARRWSDGSPGVTKRELFAMTAMQGFCANPAVFAPNGMCGWKLVNATEDTLAHYCTQVADTLIAALTHPHPEATLPEHKETARP